MKLKKLFNTVITVAAVVGVVLYIGAVGTMDYKTTIGEYYPIRKTLITMGTGFALTVPAIVRRFVR